MDISAIFVLALVPVETTTALAVFPDCLACFARVYLLGSHAVDRCLLFFSIAVSVGAAAFFSIAVTVEFFGIGVHISPTGIRLHSFNS